MRMPKSFRRKAKAEIAIHILVSLIFAVIAASYLYMFIWAIIAGAKTHTEIALDPFGLPETWNFRHYLEVFSMLDVNGTNFWGMLFNSVYFSVGDALISNFFTLTFAYCCSKYKFPGSELPYTIIMVMITLPLYGSGAAAYRLNESLGMIDSYARLVMSIGGMGMGFLYYRAYYKNVSWSYAEAAMIDGAQAPVVDGGYLAGAVDVLKIQTLGFNHRPGHGGDGGTARVMEVFDVVRGFLCHSSDSSLQIWGQKLHLPHTKSVYHTEGREGKKKGSGLRKIVNLYGKNQRIFVKMPLTKDEGCDKIPE